MGRPREFDIDQALDRAVEIFWAQGYEGTSLTHLTAAMDISRPSLYAVFGSKRELFERVIDRYNERDDPVHKEAALDEPTIAGVVREYLHRYVDVIASPAHPWGCLVVQSATRCSPENAEIVTLVADRRREGLRLLQARFERGQREGDASTSLEPESLALYVATVCEGLAARAADGVPPEQLHGIVNVALRAVSSDRA